MTTDDLEQGGGAASAAPSPRAAPDVARWARKAREATAKRDEAIRAMRTDGATLRAIAEAAGLSHTAISQIIMRVGDER